MVGKFSWYDKSSADAIGYRSRGLDATLASLKTDMKRRLAGTNVIVDRGTPAHRSDSGGALLITGFPGWLGNRAVDILINGDELGRNKTTRKVRLLVMPEYRAAVPDLPGNFEVVEGDVADPDSLGAAMAGIAAVWHFAGVIYPPICRCSTGSTDGER